MRFWLDSELCFFFVIEPNFPSLVLIGKKKDIYKKKTVLFLTNFHYYNFWPFGFYV